jgi:hypothetical protein
MSFQGVRNAVPVESGAEAHVEDRRSVAGVEGPIGRDSTGPTVHAAALERMARGAGARIVVREPHIVKQPFAQGDPWRLKCQGQWDGRNRLLRFRSGRLQWHERRFRGGDGAHHQHAREDDTHHQTERTVMPHETCGDTRPDALRHGCLPLQRTGQTAQKDENRHRVVCSGRVRSVARVVVLPTSGLPHHRARPIPGADHPYRHGDRRAEQGLKPAWGRHGSGASRVSPSWCQGHAASELAVCQSETEHRHTPKSLDQRRANVAVALDSPC